MVPTQMSLYRDNHSRERRLPGLTLLRNQSRKPSGVVVKATGRRISRVSSCSGAPVSGCMLRPLHEVRSREARPALVQRRRLRE
jgi:hypothetical protein